MKMLSKIRFWQLMVGTGFGLLLIGLVMIFLPPGVGDCEPFLIEFFEASIEGSEMGLALIVLGLSCFLIGGKDLADLRTYQGVQDDLDKTSKLTARLVADRVNRTFNGLPTQPTHLLSLPEMDVEGTRRDLLAIQNGDSLEGGISQLISQADSGLQLLEALIKEGYSV
jgi:hypothetical protein